MTDTVRCHRYFVAPKHQLDWINSVIHSGLKQLTSLVTPYLTRTRIVHVVQQKVWACCILNTTNRTGMLQSYSDSLTDSSRFQNLEEYEVEKLWQGGLHQQLIRYFRQEHITKNLIICRLFKDNLFLKILIFDDLSRPLC